MIWVQTSKYTSHIGTSWDNVEFTTAPNAGGTALQAWVETNATSSALETLVWVNLPTSLAPSVPTTIYMNFMPSSVLSSSGPTGEAPQLSSSYGQYDNGAKVFMDYQEWGGLSSLPSGWSNAGASISYSATYTTITGNGNAWASVYESTPSNLLSFPTIYDVYANIGSGSSTSGLPGLIYSACTSNAGCSCAAEIRGGVAGTSKLSITTQTCGSNPSSSTTVVNNPEVYSIAAISSTSAEFIYNYNNLIGPTTVASSAYTYITLDAVESGPYDPAIIYWSRGRQYPPKGVMPTVSFGSVS
jgi:hypothetical protein